MFEWLDRFTTFDALLWVIGWGALLLFVSTFLITRQGIRIVRYRAFEDVEARREVQPDGNQPDYADRYEELSRLGFLPAGVVRERVWFFQESICRTVRVRVLVSDDGLTYAALYRIGLTGPVRVAFDSLTDGGVFVRTVMPGAGIPESTHDFHRSEYPWRSVAELLDDHVRELQQVAARGGGQPRVFTLDERAALDQKVETRALRGIDNGDTVWYLTAWIVTFLLFDGFLWSSYTTGPRVVGLSLITAGVVYAGFTVFFMPWLIGLMQRLELFCDAQQELPDGCPGGPQE
jgi:hypothetical protein